jgi:hypothetical protein
MSEKQEIADIIYIDAGSVDVLNNQGQKPVSCEIHFVSPVPQGCVPYFRSEYVEHFRMKKDELQAELGWKEKEIQRLNRIIDKLVEKP